MFAALPRRSPSIYISSIFCTSLIFIIFITSYYTDAPLAFYCSFCQPLSTGRLGSERMLSCSNIDQKIDFSNSENIREESTSYPGWTIITNADKSKSASVLIYISKDRDSTIYFPRVSGSESFVTIHDASSWPYRRLLSKLGPFTEGKWTAIGTQVSLELRCVQNGHLKTALEVPLRITLSGPWAQIWLKDGKVFF